MLAASAGSASLSVGTALGLAETVALTGHAIRREELIFDETKDKLGEGAFGAVYKGRCRGAAVAIKQPCKDIEADQLEEFQLEVATMTSVSHPRLAMFLGSALPEKPGEQLLIVLELLSGDMDTVLQRDRKPKRLSLMQRMEWAMQAAEGIAWLHGAGLLHRDIKPSNMLYCATSKSVKVADFGLAGLLGKGEVLEDGRMVGNPRFWAPEVIDRKPWSKATDVYALGISFVTFVTRHDVFMDYWTGSSLRIEFLGDILENDLRPTLPSKNYKCPQSLRHLLERCWDKDPAKRPSCVEIVDTFERRVLLQCAIHDKALQGLWVTQVCKGSVEGGLKREVSWEALENLLFQKQFEEARLRLGEDTVSFVRSVLYRLLRNEWSEFGEEMCSLQHFGRVMGFFPPPKALGDGAWVQAVVQLTQQRWFWGDSSRLEVEAVLRMAPLGTFVVRFANQASFRLSIRCAEGTRHWFVRHGYQQTTYGVRDVPALAGKSFDSLHELAEAVAATIPIALVAPTKSPFLVV